MILDFKSIFDSKIRVDINFRIVLLLEKFKTDRNRKCIAISSFSNSFLSSFNKITKFVPELNRESEWKG